MKLYHLHEPDDYRYARAGRLGTWSPSPGVCPECSASRQERISPLIIEWLPDSDVIGDFTWPGFDDEVVITQRVREALEGRFRGFAFGPVLMEQARRLKRPQRITKRTKPRVWLPYEGPPLWDFLPTARCSLDLGLSGWHLDRICSTCGRSWYVTPAYEERHLVVDRATWGGEDVFRIGNSGWISCTERLKDFIESQVFTNVGFLPDGEIPGA